MPRFSLRQYPLSTLTILAIAVLSLAPIGAPEMVSDVPFYDKWAHTVMYCFLSFAVWYDIRCQRLTFARLLALTFVLPALFGGLMELMQAYLTDYRSGEWMDFAADALGAAVGAVYACVVAWRGRP